MRISDWSSDVCSSDLVDVVDGAAGGVGALDVVLGGVAVHQPADRAADLVVDAGLAAGADGDERLLRLRDRGAAGRKRRHRKAESSRSSIREFHRSFTPVLQACEYVVAGADRGSGSRARAPALPQQARREEAGTGSATGRGGNEVG